MSISYEIRVTGKFDTKKILVEINRQTKQHFASLPEAIGWEFAYALETSTDVFNGSQYFITCDAIGLSVDFDIAAQIAANNGSENSRISMKNDAGGSDFYVKDI